MTTVKWIFAVLLTGLVLYSCKEKEATPVRTPVQAVKVSDKAAPSEKELVARGEYLVTIIGCDDCHTPKVMGANGPDLDYSRRLSGHRSDEIVPRVADPKLLKDFVLFNQSFTSGTGAWGRSFSGNLTPDETGIGNWTFDHFKTAIRKGKFKGLENSRDLAPPMPWIQYRHMTDDDLLAVYSFLKSLPPVKNVVPALQPATTQ